MTGEMHKSEVTKENYPYHFAAAERHGGAVHPFDQYQGPYVYIVGKGRFWLYSDDGSDCYWYNERTDKQSKKFWANGLDSTYNSTRAFGKLLNGNS
jgi:hypothetical protein